MQYLRNHWSDYKKILKLLNLNISVNLTVYNVSTAP